MQSTYTFHSDPGHGWMEVPAADLAPLGLKKTDFSQYSYKRMNPPMTSSDSPQEMLYLEEDCDAPKFIERCKEKGINIKFAEVSTDNDSPIRSYQSIK